MLIFHEFTFEAAHHLPAVSGGHKCHGMHGHSYHVRIEVQGGVGLRTGWVFDYAEIVRAWEPLHKRLDHQILNDVAGLENPTAEHLAMWIWEELISALPGLAAVEVRETPTAGVRYEGQ